jgi:uncharacterized protein (TIGR02453 family)
MTGFTGFGDGAVEFYDGLEIDNSKAYWTDQRVIYDDDVLAPMRALLAALEPEFGPGKVFRPYRDVRFAKDKTPYKTHCGATVGPYYVQVGADGLMAAAGYYQMGSDQVARFRTAVAEERRGVDLEKRLAALRADGVTVAGETLKTRPRGVDPEHPRIELLRHKAIYGWRRWEPDDVLHEPGALARVATTWRVLTPLAEWLADHVGPSDQPRR